MGHVVLSKPRNRYAGERNQRSASQLIGGESDEDMTIRS